MKIKLPLLALLGAMSAAMFGLVAPTFAVEVEPSYYSGSEPFLYSHSNKTSSFGGVNPYKSFNASQVEEWYKNGIAYEIFFDQTKNNIILYLKEISELIEANKALKEEKELLEAFVKYQKEQLKNPNYQLNNNITLDKYREMQPGGKEIKEKDQILVQQNSIFSNENQKRYKRYENTSVATLFTAEDAKPVFLHIAQCAYELFQEGLALLKENQELNKEHKRLELIIKLQETQVKNPHYPTFSEVEKGNSVFSKEYYYEKLKTRANDVAKFLGGMNDEFNDEFWVVKDVTYDALGLFNVGSELNKKNDELNKKNDELNKKNDELNKEKNALEKEKETLEWVIYSKDYQLDHTHQENGFLKKQNKKKDKKIAQLEAKLKAFQDNKITKP